MTPMRSLPKDMANEVRQLQGRALQRIAKFVAHCSKVDASIVPLEKIYSVAVRRARSYCRALLSTIGQSRLAKCQSLAAPLSFMGRRSNRKKASSMTGTASGISVACGTERSAARSTGRPISFSAIARSRVPISQVRDWHSTALAASGRSRGCRASPARSRSPAWQ
jgi:hypothetical protein